MCNRAWKAARDYARKVQGVAGTEGKSPWHALIEYASHVAPQIRLFHPAQLVHVHSPQRRHFIAVAIHELPDGDHDVPWKE